MLILSSNVSTVHMCPSGSKFLVIPLLVSSICSVSFKCSPEYSTNNRVTPALMLQTKWQLTAPLCHTSWIGRLQINTSTGQKHMKQHQHSLPFLAWYGMSPEPCIKDSHFWALLSDASPPFHTSQQTSPYNCFPGSGKAVQPGRAENIITKPSAMEWDETAWYESIA